MDGGSVMSQARGLVLMPYFGRLPNIFPFWVRAASAVKQLEWLLITDCAIPCALPNNIKVQRCSFAEMQARIRGFFSYSVKIEIPWSLCSFRPAFGEIFARECENYEFWGYGDLDVIYGNLDKYLTDDVFDRYDKIFRWGHLSLIRNNDFGRTVYAKQLRDSQFNCRDAFNGRVACFDERMFNDLIEENGGMIDDSQPIADFRHRNFQMMFFAPDARTTKTAYRVREPNNPHNVFSWTSEGLFRHFVNNGGQVETEEFSYMHFCRRPMSICCKADENQGFGIVPNKFVALPPEYDRKCILRQSRNHLYWKYILPRLHPRKLYCRFFGEARMLPEK